jgi:nucleotide-binding universal stress UspA family protein
MDKEGERMWRRIMVPLDGSELAERALPCAERLALLGDATLHLVRVVEPRAEMTWMPGPLYVVMRAYADPVERAAEAAAAYLNGLRTSSVAGGIRVEVAVPCGPAAATLLDYESTAAIDLAIMCSHGYGGLVRFALGSVAMHMLRHGAAPVLLVRAFGGPVPLQRVIVPLDGSPRAEKVLGMVQELAGPVVREVTLLRVIDALDEGSAAERYLDAVAQRLPGEGLVCRREVEQGDPAQVIIDVAGTDKLVVMATHGRSALTRWALGSVADRVARHCATAVLLVRARAAVSETQ